MTLLKVSCVQFETSHAPHKERERAENVQKAIDLVSRAASDGADVVLIHELFETNYFCQTENAEHFCSAREYDLSSPFFSQMAGVAKEHGVVLPISFFERENQKFFNSVVVFDVDGQSLGVYRKTHIPTGPGYQERFYFSPGDTGFKVFRTAKCALGVAICWDQWFPETARALALSGADIILFPTAIGSEPQDSGLNSLPHWQRTIQGHAAANMTPIATANRVGADGLLRFYGHSFICDETGGIVADAAAAEPAVISALFDLAAIARRRAAWGLFRDLKNSGAETQNPKNSGAETQNPKNSGASVQIRSDPLLRRETDGRRTPAEWEQHERCFVLWPYCGWNWRDAAAPAREAFAAVVDAIAGAGEESVVVACGEGSAAAVRERFAANANVTVCVEQYDDAWARDTAPVFAVNQKKTAVLFEFDGYRDKFPHFWDSRLKEKLAKRTAADDRVESALVLEGGAFDTNGQNLAVLTKPPVLGGRNRRWAKFAVEGELQRLLGFSAFVWIERGLASDADTDGHVDNLCRFVSADTLVLHWPSDESDPDFAVCRAAEAKIVKTSAKLHLGLKIVKLPAPPKIFLKKSDVESLKPLSGESHYGRRVDAAVCRSYVNFYIANEAVIVPKFNVAGDDEARAAFERLFPERKVVQVDATEIVLGGGGIHCIVKDEPRL